MHLVGRQACGQGLQNSWEGTGRDEKAQAASGDCNREDEGQQSCPSTEDTLALLLQESPRVMFRPPRI